MVDPHDKTVLARDLQIPEQEEDAPILDGDIVLPDLDRASNHPELERLSIPELERISIPALESGDPAPRAAAPQLPRQANVPNLGGIPSLPASSQARGARPPGSGPRPAATPARPQRPAADDGSEFELPSSQAGGGASVPGAQGGPVEFDDEFESFQAAGLTNVQAQLLETVQTPIATPEVPWPTGNSPDYQSILIDPLDARVHANFGPAPRSPVRAPEYAIKVFRRRRELRAEIVASRTRAAAAETRRDERLAELTEVCRKLEGGDRLRSYFDNLGKLEQLAQERTQALAGDNQQFASEVAKYDEAAGEFQSRMNNAHGELRWKEQRLAQAQQTLARGELQYKRLLIEIRSLKTAEEESRLKGKPVDHGAKIRTLMAQVPNHQAALAKKKAARAEAQAEAAAAQQEIERIEGEQRRVKKQRNSFEQVFRQKLGLRSQGVEETQSEIRKEAAQVARALLAQRGGIAIPQATLDAVRAADDEVLKELKAQRLREAALDTYDRDGFTQGRNFIIGSIVIVLVLIAMQVFGSPGAEEETPEAEEEEDARVTQVLPWRYV